MPEISTNTHFPCRRRRRMEIVSHSFAGSRARFRPLFENIFERETRISVAPYIRLDSNGVPKWRRDVDPECEVYRALDKAFGHFDAGRFVSSEHYEKLIEELVSDEKVVQCIKTLNDIEDNVRNEATHEIVFLPEKTVKDRSGYDLLGIFNIIKEAFSYSSFHISEDSWRSYDRMNADILAAIGRTKS